MFTSSSTSWASSLAVITALLPQVSHSISTDLLHKPTPTLTSSSFKSNSNQYDEDKDNRFTLRHIVLRGNSHISGLELQALINLDLNATYSLADIKTITKRIEMHYQAAGYPFTRVWLPAQTVTNGELIINISEARVGNIQIDNQTRLADRLIAPILLDLRNNTTLNNSMLDSAITRLNDYAGVKAVTTFGTGSLPDSTDLTVTLTPESLFNAEIGIDNHGGDIDDIRTHASVHFNNPFGLGDRFNLYAMSGGKDLNYTALNYDLAVNSYGTRFAADASYLHYNNSDHPDFAVLGNRGSATHLGFGIKQSLLRTNNNRVDTSLAVDRNQIKDDYQNTQIQNHRHLDSITATISATHQYSGTSTYTPAYSWSELGYTFGTLHFDSIAQHDHNQASRHYQHINLGLGHVHNLGSSRLSASVSAQYSPNHLDSVEQFRVGGLNSASGWRDSIGGDSGYRLRLAWQYPFNSEWQGSIFAEYGGTWPKNSNTQHLSSLGARANWQHSNGWRAELTLATPIGNNPFPDHSRHPQLWFGIRKTFD